MSDGANRVFAFILAALIARPQLSASPSKLFKDVQETVNKAGIKLLHFKRDFEAAVKIGIDLGLITIRDEEVDSVKDYRRRKRVRNRSRSRSRTQSSSARRRL